MTVLLPQVLITGIKNVCHHARHSGHFHSENLQLYLPSVIISYVPTNINASLKENRLVVPSTHARWLITTVNSRFNRSDVLFWPLSTDILMHACIQINHWRGLLNNANQVYTLWDLPPCPPIHLYMITFSNGVWLRTHGRAYNWVTNCRSSFTVNWFWDLPPPDRYL